MNAPIRLRLVPLRRLRPFSGLLPPVADVPLLEQMEDGAQAAEDAAFAQAFVRAETGWSPDAWRRDGDADG